jgi:hypothetical protein
MPQPVPRALPENDGLVFAGESRTHAAGIPPAVAGQMLGTRNAHGKPNADVLRQVATAAGPHPPRIHWQVDFPPGLSEGEARLYELPFRQLLRHARPDRPDWWINPGADVPLRAALARRDRYLVTSPGVGPPAFWWLESPIIPDDTLLAVARDDDFVHGVLQARPFALWWRRFHSPRAPVLAISAYPFPWPPVTRLSALSKCQEEHRHAVARAARGGGAALPDAAVLAAYGWPPDLTDAELLTRLLALNHRRAAANTAAIAREP